LFISAVGHHIIELKIHSIEAFLSSILSLRHRSSRGSLNGESILSSFKGHNLLRRHFSNLKTKTPTQKRSNVIYQIRCNDCEGVHIGQTGQLLKNRINGHMYNQTNPIALANRATQLDPIRSTSRRPKY